MTGLLKNLLFAIGLAALLWIGYVVFLQEDTQESTRVSSGETSEATRDAQEFLVVLQELRQIELSDELFSDEQFRALVDYRQPIEREPAGRSNPFDPVE